MEEPSKFNNEDIKLTTKNGHQVVFRPFAPQKFITARRNILLKSAKMDINRVVAAKSEGKQAADVAANQSTQFEQINGTVLSELNDLVIQYMVKSIDNKTNEEAFEYYQMQMRDEDCYQVLGKALDIIGETTFTPEEKKA